jgi:hypothetical protein
VLTFGGATIEAATRRDFDRFRRSQTNLVTRDLYWTGKGAAETIKRMGLTPAAKPFADTCEAYKRYEIPKEARALVRESWPDEKQRYWVSETRGDPHRYGAQNDLVRAIVRSRSATGPVPGWEADYGMPTRRGGGIIDGSGLLFPAAYYPAANDFRSDRWPTDRSQWPAYVAAHETFADADIDFRGGATKGFAYCFAMREGMLDPHWRDIVHRKAIVARIDGQDVVSNRAPWLGASRPILLLDRDEYAFIVLYFGLGSPRGDV